MSAAAPQIPQPLGNELIDDGLGRKGNLSPLDSHLEQVPHLNARLLADPLRNDNLEFILYDYEIHDEFNCSTV